MDNLYFYALLVLCFFAVLFVIYLASTGKFAKKVEIKETKEPANSQMRTTFAESRSYSGNTTQIDDSKYRQDIAILNETIQKLKSENAKLNKQNNMLKNQIGDLTKHNYDLKKVNSDLEVQKEKLSVSKRHLEDLQKRKEDLFAMAVHDIKNPAGAIKGYVDLLTSYDLNAVEQHEIMGHLVSTSTRIIQIAQNMSVIIAEPEVNDTLNLSKSSVKNLLDNVCNRNMAYAQKKGVKIINSSSPDTPPIMMDESKMDEAIDNLINNGIKFAPSGTIVQVKSYFNRNKVLIEISDNGVGISPSDLNRIFTKGAKLSAKPTADEPSSGLGLWIVKNIIADHQGRISVDSKLGAGTKFTIELPNNS